MQETPCCLNTEPSVYIRLKYWMEPPRYIHYANFYSHSERAGNVFQNGEFLWIFLSEYSIRNTKAPTPDTELETRNV